MTLDERIIEKLVERLVSRAESTNTYILKQIAECIKELGTINPSMAYQIGQMLKYGGNYNKIVLEIARYTDLSAQDIFAIFNEVARTNYETVRPFYEYRKMQYVPWEKNLQLQKQVRAMAKITAEEFLNMSNTFAFARTRPDGKIVYNSIAETYQQTIDEAVLSISQGKDTFKKQMRKTIKEISKSGIRVVEDTGTKIIDYQTGYSRRLDTSVKMNMQEALTKMTNELQRQFGEEYGADGVEITVHENPAPDHAPLQGHQFKDEEYAKLQSRPYGDKSEKDITEYAKDIKGRAFEPLHRHIGELNCYHKEMRIIVGVSEPNYTERELQEIIARNIKGFSYEGKHYSMYEGEQEQRKLESKIRQYKDTQIMARTAGEPELASDAQLKINQLRQKYSEFSKIAKLPVKAERLKVDGYKRIKIKENNSLDIPSAIKNISESQNQIIHKRAYDFIEQNITEKDIKYINNQKVPFRYSKLEDKIIIDEKHKDLEYYKIDESIVHEVTHLKDIRNNITKNNYSKLSNIEEKAEMYVMNNQSFFYKFAKKYRNDMATNDIISALSGGRIQTSYYHDKKYWNNKEIKINEISANIISGELTENQILNELINEIPPLKHLKEECIKLWLN